jgi:hypothetical protein
MFDINYYNLLNDIKVLVDKINDYSKLKDCREKDAYIEMFNTFIQDHNIDYDIYTQIRGYLMLCDAYFRDYETSYLDKKLEYIKRNIWKDDKNNLIRVKC